jgi:DNA mismatch repair protein MutS
VLISFADLVTLSPHSYVAPDIVDDGPLVIKAGRHPIIHAQSGQRPVHSSFVPNDIMLSKFDNVHIITGPNGAGKVRTID